MKRLLLVALGGCLVVLGMPASALAVGTMSGQVFYDPPFGPNVPIQGVQVQLRTQGGGAEVGSPDTTDASGNYSVTAFANGSLAYKIRLLPPVAFSPISPVSGEITNIVPSDGATTSGLNFSVKGATISGLVFQDRDGNGTKNGSDSNLGGATVSLVGPVSKTLTSATPAGTFTTGSPILPAGSYTVTASKTGYDATTSSQIASPVIGAAVTTANLGLRFATGTVEGDVYAETNGTPGRQAGEPPVPGAPIAVSGTYDSVEAFTLNTTSGADGTFSLPGVYVGSNRTITAAQPAAYADGAEFTSAAGATAGADQFTTVTVAKNASSGRFQFGETGATISGLTFADCDADGQSDAGESSTGNRGIAVAATGLGQVDVTSAADGTYSVSGLPGGVDVTLTPKTTSDGTAPLAKIASPVPGGTIGNVLFGYLGLCDPPKDTNVKPPGTEPGKVSIVAGKRTNVSKGRLSLTCRLDRGSLKSCKFAILTKRKRGKLLASGKATANGSLASLKVTLKLSKLGRERLESSPESLRGIASVVAVDENEKTLTATKAVKLRRR